MLPPVAISPFRRLIRASKYLPGRFSSSRNPLFRDSLSEMHRPLLGERALRLRPPLLAFPASWPASPALRQRRPRGALLLSLAQRACPRRLVRSATSRRYYHRHPHPRCRLREFQTRYYCRDPWRAPSLKCDRDFPARPCRNGPTRSVAIGRPAFTAVMRLSTMKPTGTLRSRIPTILPRLTGAFAIRARIQRPKKLKRMIASTNAKSASTATPTR